MIDLSAGTIAALLEWHSGIEEIFDVRLNTFSRSPFLSGPHAQIRRNPPGLGGSRLRGTTSPDRLTRSGIESPWRARYRTSQVRGLSPRCGVDFRRSGPKWTKKNPAHHEDGPGRVCSGSSMSRARS